MKLYLPSLVFFTAAVVARQPSALVINTPANVVECQSLAITWSGGKAPYSLEIVPGGDPNGAPIESLGEQTGDEMTWVVNLASGTSIGFTLKDSLGDLAQTAPVTVTSGTSTACLAA